MVSMLNSRSSDLDLSPGLGHCVVFVGKILDSNRASLHPGVQYKLLPANLMLRVTMQWTSITSRGEEVILLVASCYRNQALV